MLAFSIVKHRRIEANDEMQHIRQLPGFDVRRYAISKEDRNKYCDKVSRMNPKGIQWGVLEIKLRGKGCTLKPIPWVLRELKTDVTQPYNSSKILI